MKITEIRIEYQIEPIGLDEPLPGFSWKLTSDINNTKQSSYRIIVKEQDNVYWDSGEVYSDKTVCILYQGKELNARTEYSVLVYSKDNYGNEDFKQTKFETGLLHESNFKGEWITHSIDEKKQCIPVFEKMFDVSEKIVKARLYVTCCGIYDATLNGEKIGDQYFTPGWTTYPKRILYQTYDITEQISNENQISISIANGWYKGIIGFNNQPNFYGDKVALKAAIWIKYRAREEWITTDNSWDVFSNEIVSSEIYNGEIIDLTKKEVSFGKAIIFNPEGKIGKIESEVVEPVRIIQKIKPKRKFITPEGELVIDYGQNLTGVIEVTLPQLINDELIIRHAESLDERGNFYVENLRRAKATDVIRYTEEDIGRVVMPKFTFHGFRYISLEGVDKSVDMNCFIACELHSDLENTGTFSCNNPLINQLQSNISWSAKGNFFDIPMDCPQRDERLGWTGDAQIFINTAAYNMNIASFIKKWLSDVVLEQTNDYGPAHVVPNILGNIEAGAGWSDSVTIIPWAMYLVYGDERFLSRQYNSMVCYIEYVRERCNEKGLWQTGLQYGDWLSLDRMVGENTGITDEYLLANAYYLNSLKIVYLSARILKKEDDFRKYKDIYETTKLAYQKEYFTETGRIVSETQTACILPLQFGLVKEEHTNVVVDTLLNKIYNNNLHLTTGFMGTPFLCPVLSKYDHHDLATRLLLAEDIPSWLYQVNMGATTIWERWDSILPDGSFNPDGMNSLNHYANGSIGAWIYEEIAGIQRIEPGYRKIRIAPRLTSGIYQVDASFETNYGTIKCSYVCENEKIVVDITIPTNTTAEIYLPEKDEVINVGSGNYCFEYPIKTDLKLKKYSMFSPVKDVLQTNIAKDILNHQCPDTLKSPILGIIWEKPLYLLSGVMSSEKSEHILENIVEKLNQAEE